MEPKQVWLVYAGEDRDVHRYFIIEDLARNNGEPIVNEQPFGADKKIFKTGIGCIHEVTLVSDGNISYKKDALPKQIWKCRDDLTAWSTRDKGTRYARELEKKSKDNHLATALEPIRAQYARANRNVRRAILAEVLRVITGE